MSSSQDNDWDIGACPIPIANNDEILLGHGSGGKLTHDLIEQLFLPAFSNPILDRLDDQAVITLNGSRLAFSTDSYVVDPIIFPGGDIGQLAINGTVNDLCMSGARPLYLSAAFILEEGLRMEVLEQIVESMRVAASQAGVMIVTGDTKVVNKGSGDKIFINTTGIGLIDPGLHIGPEWIREGDKVLLSGTIGDHGIAIMAQRESLTFETVISSDTAPLHTLVRAMLETTPNIHCMRDPTRGGLASILNEIACQSDLGIVIEESEIPVRPEVKGAYEILGLDPLYIANEGKLVAFVDPAEAEAVLRAMRAHPYGQDSSLIGEVVKEPANMVLLNTEIGGKRIVDMLLGEQLPRIC